MNHAAVKSLIWLETKTEKPRTGEAFRCRAFAGARGRMVKALSSSALTVLTLKDAIRRAPGPAGCPSECRMGVDVRGLGKIWGQSHVD